MFISGFLLLILTSSDAIFDDVIDYWYSNDDGLINNGDEGIQNIPNKNNTNVTVIDISKEILRSQKTSLKASEYDEIENMYDDKQNKNKENDDIDSKCNMVNGTCNSIELKKLSALDDKILITTNPPEATVSDKADEKSQESHKSDEPVKIINVSNEIEKLVSKWINDQVSDSVFTVLVDENLPDIIKAMIQFLLPDNICVVGRIKEDECSVCTCSGGQLYVCKMKDCLLIRRTATCEIGKVLDERDEYCFCINGKKSFCFMKSLGNDNKPTNFVNSTCEVGQV